MILAGGEAAHLTVTSLDYWTGFHLLFISIFYFFFPLAQLDIEIAPDRCEHNGIAYRSRSGKFP